MYLNRLYIENLYGKNFNIRFNNELTILYGVNGSGKTTVLDIIYNIMSGDIYSLSKYKFRTITADITIDSKLKRIFIFKKGNNIEIEYDTIKYLFAIGESNSIQRKYPRYNEIEILDGDYLNRMKNSDQSIDLWNEVDMTYIPLDRRVKQGPVNNSDVVRKRIYNHSSSNSEKTKINSSLDLAQQYYSNHIFETQRINLSIQREIEKKLVRELSSPITEIDLIEDLSELEMIGLKDKFKNLFLSTEENRNISQLIDENIHQKKLLNWYRNRADNDSKAYYEDVLKKYYFGLMQIIKLNNVYKSVIEQKQFLEKLSRTSKNTINSINLFFSDTDKELIAKRDHLVFNNVIESNLDLKMLSSGEKQLVILLLFSMLELQENRGRKKIKLFLADEPELSLHIAWQSKLLPTIMKSNENTQIIIATHSPDIIGSYDKNCVEVRGERYDRI